MQHQRAVGLLDDPPLGDRYEPRPGVAAQDLFEKLIAVDVPCGVIQNVVEALAHPHTAHRGMVAEVDGHRSVASPIKLSRTPASYRSRPQEIGESTVRVLTEAGLDAATIDRLLAAGIVHQAEADKDAA